MGEEVEHVSTVAHVVRWLLGLFCVGIEITVAAIVIAGVKHSGVDTNSLLFWHPALMSVGVLLFLSHGIRTYIAYYGVSRNVLRIVHGICNALWVIFGIVGMALIVQFKRDNLHPHFHSYARLPGFVAAFLFRVTPPGFIVAWVLQPCSSLLCKVLLVL